MEQLLNQNWVRPQERTTRDHRPSLGPTAPENAKIIPKQTPGAGVPWRGQLVWDSQAEMWATPFSVHPGTQAWLLRAVFHQGRRVPPRRRSEDYLL